VSQWQYRLPLRLLLSEGNFSGRYDSRCILPVQDDFALWLLAFGIGAPRTFEGAAFEENYCTNSRSVIYAEFLNVENHPGRSVFLHYKSTSVYSCILVSLEAL
jgi:hypothetical protein